ncbi:ArsR/SmtB family transcription factor [Nonlabens xiamenensis]|uniref:ArsR/SmtB family transcription factor n=1 Tax=Nonlabens xiamenensis TaxID=2341043 RepID=UPI000F60514D|nr:metalloregulator ArsR/SmtB family transcription factor [Nonlabens xiamenensis]
MADVFKAIADQTRREILLMLIKDSNNIGEIAQQFNMTRPAVAKHIKILQSANLVGIQLDKNDSRQRICFAQLEALQEVQEYLSELEKYWQVQLKGLGEFLQHQHKK